MFTGGLCDCSWVCLHFPSGVLSFSLCNCLSSSWSTATTIFLCLASSRIYLSTMDDDNLVRYSFFSELVQFCTLLSTLSCTSSKSSIPSSCIPAATMRDSSSSAKKCRSAFTAESTSLLTHRRFIRFLSLYIVHLSPADAGLYK